MSQVRFVRSPNKFAKWRVSSLIAVHLLIVGHIIHWKIAGRTLAPVELHEVMVTAELGIVTAGFIFMSLAVLSTAVFGRFFCSWGCHLLALQDLCAWLLGKLRITPKPVRSRALWIVAPSVMVYMFVWPQISRLLQGRPPPPLRVASPEEPWASFITTDMWRNLPGPVIAILTLLICGCVVVYLLGSRSFCRYICPYGVVFGGADRISPWRIRLKKGISSDHCLNCGVCTGVCQTHIRVHEEVAEHGTVVSPQCLKDLDCVSACPQGALQVSYGKLALFSSWFSKRVKKVPYDFSLFEDALVALTFLPFLFIFRGLYEQVPFLMSLGIAVGLSYMLILTIRFIKRPNVRLNNFQLRLAYKFTTAGRLFFVFIILLWGFVGHSAIIRWHEIAGMRKFDKVREQFFSSGNFDHKLAQEVRWHLNARLDYGLFKPVNLHRSMASICSILRDYKSAEEHLRIILKREAGDAEAALRLGGVLMELGESLEAKKYLEHALSQQPNYFYERELYDNLHLEANELLAGLNIALGNRSAAILNLRGALAIKRDQPELLLQLGSLLIVEERFGEAVSIFETLISFMPNHSEARFYLGMAYEGMGFNDKAMTAFLQLLRQQPDHAFAYHRLGLLYEKKGYREVAYSYFRKAVEIEPSFVAAQKDLSRIRKLLGSVE